MSQKFSAKIFFPLAASATALSLIPQSAQAAFFASSVSNSVSGPVVNINYDPINDIVTSTPNFTAGNSSILKYDETTGVLLGTFPFVRAGLGIDNIHFSSGITFYNNILYAADQGYNPTYNPNLADPNDPRLKDPSIKYGRIVKFDGRTGDYLGDAVPYNILTSNGLTFPEDVRFIGGNMYVSGLGGGGVQKFDGKTGAYLGTVASTNSLGKALIAAGLNVGPDGNLYISSVLNDSSIRRYNPTTGILDTFIPPAIAQPVPSGSTFTPDGQKFLNGTFITFNPNDPITVKQYSSTACPPQSPPLCDLGFFVGANNGGLQSSSRLIFGPDGNLYVSDYAGNKIMRFNGSNGTPIGTGVFISGDPDQTTHSILTNPGGIAFFTPVPESSYWLGILGFGGCLAASSVLKSKQKKQKSANLDSNRDDLI